MRRNRVFWIGLTLSALFASLSFLASRQRIRSPSLRLAIKQQNIWAFLRRSDGTYAVYQNGNLRSDSIPESKLNDEVCVRYGFCGHEYEAIYSQLNRSGKCIVDLNSSSPTQLKCLE